MQMFTCFNLLYYKLQPNLITELARDLRDMLFLYNTHTHTLCLFNAILGLS